MATAAGTGRTASTARLTAARVAIEVQVKPTRARTVAAALLALACGALVLAVARPGDAVTAAGVTLAAWLVAGTLTELYQRVRGGGFVEAWRRLFSLPRGSWGMSLAHLGLGVFILGAALETSGRIEAAKVLGPGQSMSVAGYQLALVGVGDIQGPNYSAQRASLSVTRGGAPICQAGPERRFYPANQQNTSRVAICVRGLSDLYLVLGEPRTANNGQPAWLVRAYWNPFVRLIFLGPLTMALGGALSLSDRRLRLGVPRRAAPARAAPEPAT